MEPRRHAERDLHNGERSGSDVFGRKDRQFAGRCIGAVNQRHRIAIGFFGAAQPRREDQLSCCCTRTEVINILGSALGIEAQHRVHALDPAIARIEIDIGKAVAALAGHQPVIGSRELNVTVVQDCLGHRTSGNVDRPAAQRLLGIPMAQPFAMLIGEQRSAVRRRDIGDDFAAFLPHVKFVEHVARIEFEPAHLVRPAFARHHPDLGRAAGIPRGHRPAAHEPLEVGIDRDNRKDHPVLGQEKGMDQRVVRHRDHGTVPHFAACGDDIIAQFRCAHVAVNHGPDVNHFAGGVVNLGVR